MSSNGPTGERLIRVDMTRESVAVDPFPEKWKLLGGRGLSARILLEECDASCDPLGPDNVLVLAPGALAGTSAPTSGRISVGAKSPLTHGIKEANAGGNPGQHLTRLGYRAIVVTGQPADPERRFGLEVTAEGARLVPADEHKGQRNYPLCEALAQRYPKNASFISVGPAGEQHLAGASVACTDQDNRVPTRHAGRGGLGAVMGSKGLKFVAIDPGRARVRPPADAKRFNELAKELTSMYRDGPQIFARGTAAFVPTANSLHTFPHKNRTSGQSPDVQSLDGARINESFATRGGKMHNCLTGCVVQCSNIVHDADGNYKTSALEFETLTLFGSNCALSSWEDVADLDRLCDDIGLDTIETGAAVAVYMDAGKLEWGDAEGTKRVVDEIGKGTERGKLIGNGAVSVGRGTGHERVPAVRGQAIPAWDPRPLNATGVTYATSAMGADHTAGLIINPGMPQDEYALRSQELQMINAIVDSSGFCQFLGPNLDEVRAFLEAMYGEEVSRERIADYGWQILQDEWEFNRRAGWKEEDDDLPACMKAEGVGPDGSQVFNVPQEIIRQAKVRQKNSDGFFTQRTSG